MSALSRIHATGPWPEYAEQVMLYGQFVGSWNIDSKWFDDNGKVSHADGEWHFDWILGGRGIQDVLFRSGDPPDKFGTTLRCYDPGLDAWHISWMQPCAGEFVHLIGSRAGACIVQQGDNVNSRRQERWSFSNITKSSFQWRGEVSLDAGATWKLVQEMTASRR